MDSLDSAGFVQLINAGHAWLKQHAESVNALNVFPVPDGDTGTNMELSLASGVRALARQTDWTMHAAIQSLNQGLLMGARGNSGVILSQLFRGFLRIAPSTTRLYPTDLAQALQDGVQIAYNAVSKPVEGTILTVAREAAQVAVRESKGTSDMAVWLTRVVAAARESLARTPSLLPVLREANVVDSGGQGLLFIYEGFLRFVSGQTLIMDELSSVQPRVSDFGTTTYVGELQKPLMHQTHAGKNEFGYCTEVLVRISTATPAGSEERIREKLSEYGDSLLVVQAEDLLKVHVHTLHPGRVLEDALVFGPLIQVKIENMTEQNSALMHSAPEPTGTNPGLDVAVIVVASGQGIKDIFQSLGASYVVDGGSTMNPSTEDIAAAIIQTNARSVIVLPNHKNVQPSAEQARDVVSSDVHIVTTQNVPEGIAAMMAFHANHSLDTNLSNMTAAVQSVISGQVARAAREAVYQNQEIHTGQYLGLSGSQLVFVGDSREEAAMHVLRDMITEDAELMTLFYGESVAEADVRLFVERVETAFGISVESRYGGQSVYEYIFSVE